MCPQAVCAIDLRSSIGSIKAFGIGGSAQMASISEEDGGRPEIDGDALSTTNLSCVLLLTPLSQQKAEDLAPFLSRKGRGRRSEGGGREETVVSLARLIGWGVHADSSSARSSQHSVVSLARLIGWGVHADSSSARSSQHSG
jgi:hypothetical protein